MRDYLNQARTALSVYLQRGQEALSCPADSGLENLNSILTRRKAAFHNFRVASVILEQQGLKFELMPDMVKIWDEVRVVDSDVEKMLLELRNRTMESISKFSKIRENLGKYRSGTPSQARFEMSV